MILNDVKKGKLHKARKRLGCGTRSGHGKQSGRGEKGATKRSGFHLRPMFLGTAVPLYMKFPKRGFGKGFLAKLAGINVGLLARYAAGETIDPERLERDGVVKKAPWGLKVLGGGDLKVALTVKAHAFSQSAEEKIKAVGGTAIVLGAPTESTNAAPETKGKTE